MRAAVLDRPGKVDIVDRPADELVEGSVLVGIDRCGIGGSDVQAYLGGRLPSPAWFGHEWVGRVAAIGPGVTGRFEGERVVGATCPPCGACPPCEAGTGSVCDTVLSMILGTDRRASPHGAFAETIRVDARRLHRAPDGIDDDEAALTEPAAVATHAVARSGQRLGDLVAVVGAGTIGLLVAQLARLAGAARVVAIDTEPGRQELACSLGADAAFSPGPDMARWLGDHGHGHNQSHRLGADVVYECAGHPEALSSAVTAARPGGTVTVVGVASAAGSVTTDELVSRELTLRASLGYTVADVHRALDLMADNRLRVAPICDRVIGFAELPAAFVELASVPSAPRKVLVAPGV